MWAKRHSKILAHDENEECRAGDRVIIRETKKMSRKKAYYVRNIVWENPRHEIFNPKQHENKLKLQSEYKEVMTDMMTKEYRREHFLNEKQAHSKRKDIKQRAMIRAMMSIREIEKQKAEKNSA